MKIEVRVLSYNPNKILGESSLGTFVFKGLFKRDALLGTALGASKVVAIKRIHKNRFIHDDIKQELEILINLPHHPNLLRYLWTEIDKNFL